jgi:uncharacterized protein YjbJ (UPF0337 family)
LSQVAPPGRPAPGDGANGRGPVLPGLRVAAISTVPISSLLEVTLAPRSVIYSVLCARPRGRQERLCHIPPLEENTMGLDDKIKHGAEEASGKAKEATGKATDDESMQAEGRADQSKANMKQAGDKVKDAASDAKDAFNK